MCFLGLGKTVPCRNSGRPQRRGRSPDRPAGCDTEEVGKDVHVYTVGSRGDVGIAPYKKITCVSNVGDDPQIVPPGTTPGQSEKTYTPIPSACEAMWASPPTLNSVRDYRTYRLPLVPVPENTQNRPLGKNKRTVLRIPYNYL